MDQKVRPSRRTTRALQTIAIATVAFVLGGMFASPNDRVHAQFERTPPQKAFLSGGARSEKVLLEISATAKRIEQQLVNIEGSLKKMDGN